MSTSRKLGAAIALGLLTLSLPTPASAEPSVRELTPLPDGSSGHPSDINDHDVTVGSGAGHAVKWYAGGLLVDLGTFDGEQTSDARAINNGNIAVGQSGTHAVRWEENNTIIELAPAPDTKVCAANDINDYGVAVGFCGSHAVRWDNLGAAQLLPAVPGDTASEALGVDSEGTAVGWSQAANGDRRPVIWPLNGTAEILPGGTLGQAYRINDWGRIAGRLDDQPVTWNYFAGTVTRLDSRPGSAVAINEGDAAVGVVYETRNARAVRWQDGETTPLPGLAGEADYATAINGSNVVVGVSGGRAVRWRG